ncbi:MAG TPA: hypothetical protein VGQ81_00950 [Acidobacteriota bacterium]|nr:hypothetical protein [Acidobacteriota bacterium]
MKILVVFATQSEFRPWRKLRAFGQVRKGQYSIYAARVGQAEVSAVITGIGSDNARRVVRSLLSDEPDLCISSGLAGGLRPEHFAQQILAARAVRAAGVERPIPSDETLFGLAVRCGAKPADLFYTSEIVLVSSEDKRRMSALADAVEMESFAVLKEASASQIPAAAIRVIADPVDVDLPLDFNRVLASRGTVSVSQVLAQLTRDPQRLPALARFSFQSISAARSLALFLDRYVEALARQDRSPMSLAHMEAR